ncbi:MAG: pyridoxamine 5'-phosphate oxidase family protein [Solirubrobacteraceae bacterium]
MGDTLEAIDDRLSAWIARQSMFFVATAPLAGDGHVNVSPKGPIGTLRVLGPHRVAYVDLVGSGSETVAHLRENGRIVVMLCAFDGPPRIVRLHGSGEVVAPGEERFEALMTQAAFEEPTVPEARRALVLVEVTRIATSCGYGVPLMSYEAERPHMHLSKAKRLRTGGPDALERYVAEHNATSIDGLPSVETPRDA